MSTARTELRRLRRSSDGRVIAGLCVGVGRELRVDPVVLRVILALLTVYSGVGLLFYLAGWVLVPAEEGSAGSARTQRWRFVIGLITVLVGLLVVPWWGLEWHSLSLALLLLVGFYVLLRRGPAAQPGEPAAGAGSPLGADAVGQSATGTPAGTATAAGGHATTPVPAGGARPASSAAPGTHVHATVPPAHGWPARSAPTGEDAVHTVAIPTGWALPGTEPGEPERPDPDATGQSPDQPAEQPAAEPSASSWRRFEPAPREFWEQKDPLGLADPWQHPDPLRLHEDEQDQQAPAAAHHGGPAGRTGRRGDTVALPANAAGRERGKPRLRGRLLLPLCTLLGVLAATGLVGASGDDPPVSAYAAVSLGVIGAGLIVGTWVGRSVTLIVLGVLISLTIVPVTAADLVGADPGSPRTLTKRVLTSVDEIPRGYEFGAGDIRLDLSGVPFSDSDDVRTGVELGSGQLVVLVPPEVDVSVSVEMGGGDLQLFGEHLGGWSQDRRVTDRGADGAGGGRLDLRIESGFGAVEVQRVQPSSR